MGAFRDYMMGRAMRNPKMMQMFQQQQEQEQNRQYLQSLMGSAPVAEQTESYQMSAEEMMPGEQPIQGLETVTQEASPGEGYLGGEYSPQEMAMRLAMAPGKQTRGAGLNILQQQNQPRSRSSMSTFEVGVPDQPGMKQRMHFDASGSAVPVGAPYRAFAPQAPSSFQEKLAALRDPNRRDDAVLAMRDPYLETATGYQNPYDPTATPISKNVAQGAYQKKEGGSAQDRIFNYEANIARNNSLKEVFDDSKNVLRDLFSKVGINTAGPLGVVLSSIPGTDAYNWSEVAATINSRNTFDALQDLKDQAANGASGLGQVTEIEIKLLMKKIASLKQGQSPSQLKTQILRVVSEMERLQKKAQRASERETAWYEKNAPKYVNDVPQVRVPNAGEDPAFDNWLKSQGR